MEVLGRDDEIADVEARLSDRRLVTVVGPGGIGKTLLVRVVAEHVAPRMPLGAVHVDLTRVDDPGGVAEAVAGQLGYADFRSLLDSPGDQPVLLVLDNCEHVLDAAADVTERMLAACRMPRIVATSRAPLDLDGESVVSLGALPTPSVGWDDPDNPSLRLLVARAHDHGVEIGADELADAAEVCRRLDGVPLAIEIAAARLRVVGLSDLLAELEAAPHALARRRFRGEQRHRSVADLVAWSYELLEPDEQRVFVGLGVFGGPFTADLARRVLALDDVDWDAALDGLIAASLVVVDRSGDVTRYRLLHPVRAVALDRLDRAGEAATLRSRLVDEICARSLDIVRGGPSGWSPSNLHDLLALYDHAAGSIRWALAHDDDPDRALLLVAILWGIVHNAHSDEIHALGEVVLERWPDPTVPRWPNAAATVATCRFLRGDTDGAISLARSALAHADRSRSAPALLRRVTAQSLRAAGDVDAARREFAAAADAAEERGAHGLVMELRVDEGLALVELGDHDAGVALIEAMVDEAVERDAPINRCWARAALASARRRREGSDALPFIRDVLDEARAIGYPAGTTFALRLLAAAALEGGDTRTASEALIELLDHLLQRGGLDEMRVVLDLVAEVMRRHQLDGWPDVAATAAELPITSFLTPTELDFLPVDRPVGSPLAARDAYVLARSSLLTVLADEHRRAEGDGHPPATVASAEAGSDPDAGDGPVIAAEGDVWRLTWEGGTIRVKASKGIDDLVALLGAPGREVSALDLMGGGVAPGAAEDELIDDEARRQYEQRVRELQAELDEAEAHHDVGRSEQLRAELDAIVDELTSALGLGGRSRRTSGAGERARSAVTQRIRSTVKRIEEHHPALGDHLRRSVSTGIFCRYEPAEPVRWTIRR